MSALRAVAAGFALALLSAVPAQAATVYKWTNDQGVVQYTDAPPEGRKFQRLEVGGAGSRAAAEPAPVAAADPAAAAEPNTAQRRIDGMKRACEVARANVENLEKFQQISMDKDGDGNAELLDDTARNEELERNRRQVEQFCVDAPAPAATAGDDSGE